MLSVIISYISCMINTGTTVFVAQNVLEDNLFKVNFKNLIIFLLMSICIYLNYNYSPDIEKLVISFLTITLFSKLLFKKAWTKTIISSFIIFLLYILAEIIIMPLWIVITKVPSHAIETDALLQFFGNLIINSFILICISIKAVKRKIIKTIAWVNNQKISLLMIIIILILFIISNNIYSNSIQKVLNVSYIYNCLIVITTIIIAVFIVNEKGKTEKVRGEYDVLLEYVKTYEEWMEEERKKRHEDRNQIIVIKSLASKNNKELINYLETIIKEPTIIKYDWVNKLKCVPKGGLKGLLYYKIVEMKTDDIEVYINISEEIVDLNLNNIGINRYKEIFRIIGVFLDNAKEATLDAKEKIVSIELYNNNNKLHLTISNTFNGILKVEEFGNERYTTKGKGRGYGLSLVNDIIRKNKGMSQKREIVDNLYIQHLIIEIN